MWNAKWYWVAGALFCLSCGGSSQNTPPQEPSSESEPESTSEAPAPEKKETAEPTEKAAEPNEGPAPGKAGEAEQKPCPSLDQSTCKVTMGCVWNDVKKCVQETSADQ
jgi:hypothetical protein